MSPVAKLKLIFPRHVKIKMIFLVISIVVGAQIETLTLSLIQPFIMTLTDPSIIYTNRILNFVFTFFNFSGVILFLAFLAIAIAFIYTFRGFYVYFLTRFQNRFLAQNTAALSNSLLIQTLGQPYLYHANNNLAKLQQIVIRNAERLYGLVNNALSLLIDGFMTLFILVFLIISSFSMTMVVLFFAAICIAIYICIFRGRIKSSGDDEQRGMIQINKSVIQALHGVKEIKIMQKEKYFAKKFESVNRETVKVREQVQSMRQLPKLFMESLCFSGAFLVVAVVIFVGVDMQTLIPQLGVFMLAAFKLLPAISRMLNNITQIVRHMPSIQIVYRALYEQDQKYAQKPPDPDINIISKDIIVDGVKFKYPRSKKVVLSNVSFTIPHNTTVGIIGPSGSGKSTLVDLILGILYPQEGSIIFDGKSIHHDFEDWAKNVGYVPQTIYMLDENIKRNVAFGVDKKKINEDKVWYALEQAQLKELVENMQDGLMTMVGDRGVKLSGGQRQRIGIARALYSNPSILVLDEATSSLDNLTESAVMDAIKSFRGQKTIIIVTHRLSTIEHCDIVYKIKKGRVVEVR